METNNKKGQIISAALAPGLMTTSAIIFPMLFLKNKFKDGLIIILKAAALALGLMIVMGRINMLFHFPEYLTKMKVFADSGWSLINRAYSCLDLMASSIFVLPFVVTNFNTFRWAFEFFGAYSVGYLCDWLHF